MSAHLRTRSNFCAIAARVILISSFGWLAALAGCTDVDSNVAGPASLSADGAIVDSTTADSGKHDAVVDTGAADGENGDTVTDGAITDAGPSCAGGCDDGNPCTADTCTATGCVSTAASGACDDGNPCTHDDHCKDGACASGTLKSCDDGDACTADSCDPATGTCKNAAQSALPCNDGNACTTSDTCKGGACVGAAKACDDGKACTDDSCLPESGCKYLALPAVEGSVNPCDDGDACTLGDHCSNGNCVGPGKLGCDDGDACTSDLCSSKKGCIHEVVADGSACNDGMPCSIGDSCKAGVCTADTAPCGCIDDNDCVGDDNLCNGELICDKSGGIGVCSIKVATVVVCTQSGPCVNVACTPSTGACVATNLIDGKSCDADGDVCTVSDACKAGVCVAGNQAGCDDNNVCTTDSCDAKKGCTHTAGEGACDADGNPCTVFDGCKSGICVPGPAKNCFDGNPCTLDSCDPKSGTCVADATAANGLICDADGSVCTVADACSAGVCKSGSALTCDDGNPCSTDSCHPIDGCKKAANAQPCEDGDFCTIGDGCTAGKCASGGLKGCDDGDKCTIDSCDSKTGLCVHDKLAGCSKKCGSDAECKDSNTCTVGVCDSGICTTSVLNVPCDDGSACTVGDACVKGVCTPGNAKDCNDNNPCTDDSCHVVAGCTNYANAAGCDADGDPCTAVDACKDKVCVQGVKKGCDDGSPCTIDGCDSKTGNCTHDGKTFEGDPCNADNSVCTIGDACASGVCAKGKALVCNDSKDCTNDSCDPAKGCVHVANAGACEDGDACTVGDGCTNGACKSGAAKVCDDKNDCTSDSCNSKDGTCVATPIAGCGGGCTSDSACDDNKGCTKDTCSKGVCTNAPVSGACGDFDACISGGTCKAGVCAGGKATDCDDGKACTTDACDSKTGQCTWTTNTAPCEDGNPCTLADGCALGVCKAGKAKNCDDSNGCTVDACDPKTGDCLHQNADGGSCDDGDACTADDRCAAGKCIPSGKADLSQQIGTGKAGYVDGDAKVAMFNQPWGIGRGPGNTVMVADLGSHTVRQISPDGSVKTYAGTGKPGWQDGPALKASFWSPSGLDRDAEGNIYVADLHNHRVRKISVGGTVSTFAGEGTSGWKDGFKSTARFDLPVGIAVDAAGVYVSELSNHTIRLVTWDGMVVTVGGQPGKKGLVDGNSSVSRFDSPYGLAIGPGGGLYIADSGNHRIRFLTAANVVLTAAGSSKGFVDGPIQIAKFDSPIDVALLPSGNLLVADRGNLRLRLMGLDGKLSTIYGNGDSNVLSEPFGVVADGAGRAYVCSFDKNLVWQLKLSVTECADGDSCTIDTCDKTSGSCKQTKKANGEACGDGCFGAQICNSGACQTGIPKDCDDNEKCTSDYCADNVCKHVPVPNCK